MERIINSNLDTDYYKLTMGQLVHHQFSQIQAGYEFIDRGKTSFPDRFDNHLQQQIERMSEIRLSPNERNYLLGKCQEILTPDYVDWFASFHFNPDEVKILRQNNSLSIQIEGPWEKAIYWEVPLMATISELYFKETGQNPTIDWQEKAGQKARRLEELEAKFAEFGTRRRYSYQVQERVLQILKQAAPNSLLGTSNVELAMKYDLKPVGTFAHEYVMALSGIFGPNLANPKALELWTQEFNGKLNTALPDTFTTEVFLRTFTPPDTEIFTVLRQDSGNTRIWTDKVVNHLQKLGIDPLIRTALYSDSLDIDQISEILQYNRNKIRSLFGIGRNLTNDVGVKPLNIVIKLNHIILENGQRIGVCKLSDDLGKVSGDPAAVQQTIKELKIDLFQKEAA